MGFLTFNKGGKPELKRLASGTFTVDPHGHVVSSTVPASVPDGQIREIGRHILGIFQGAQKVNLQFTELVVQYAAFKITARQMRGGAIIFLSPRGLQTVQMS
jgi:hypothetical protein